MKKNLKIKLLLIGGDSNPQPFDCESNIIPHPQHETIFSKYKAQNLIKTQEFLTILRFTTC